MSAADVARRNELARKNAAREALRRKGERRAYKPASVWIIGKLMCMYVGLVIFLFVDIFLTALACYVNPAAKKMDILSDYAWNCLCCFSLLGLPALLLHLAGYVFLPPVWGESFPEREKVLEELGGKLYFRFHWTRKTKPIATKRAVDVATEVLSRTLPSTLWEVEVITEDDLYIAGANTREYSLPVERKGAGVSWTGGGGGGGGGGDENGDGGESGRNLRGVGVAPGDDGVGVCDLLTYAVERSSAGWGDWIVHLGCDTIINQRAVDAVLFHCSRESRLVALSPLSKPRARRVAQGAVLPGLTRTANSVEGGVPTMFAWIPAMAEVVRAGEAYGAMHLMYNRQRVVAPVPDTFVVVPNELERSVGWPTRHTPPGTEMTSFALRCGQLGVKFSWLDAGVHVPIVPGLFALFRQRVRDHAGNLLLMGEDSALEPRTQTFLAVYCVSNFFAKIAPILTAISPLVIHMPGESAFVLACLVGVTTALVRFVYALGFYVSSGARHLARGPAGYVLYWILFALTLALTPLFSAFELVAMIASVFAAPTLREGHGGVGGYVVTEEEGNDHHNNNNKGGGGGRRKNGGGGGGETTTATTSASGNLVGSSSGAGGSGGAAAPVVAGGGGKPMVWRYAGATREKRAGGRSERWFSGGNAAPVKSRNHRA